MKERGEEEFNPVKLFREMQKDLIVKDEIPAYRINDEPFWGTGCDDDIFKAHPEALKAIPYKPRHK